MQELQDEPIESSEALDFLTLEASSPTSAPMPLEELPVATLEVLPKIDPVLAKLPESKRPPEKLACATCPAAMWMTGATTLQAFCQIMRVIAWSQGEQAEIEECTGRLQALEALQASH